VHIKLILSSSCSWGLIECDVSLFNYKVVALNHSEAQASQL